MFERSYLPAAQLEFVVLTDTHYMVDSGDAPVEFESRRKQTARVEHALRLAAALKTPFLMHLGDLIQEHPRSPHYRRALDEARAQLDRHLAGSGSHRYHAAGNQDIGDKPDPTMPTEPVTPDSLAAYGAVFGSSWYSFDVGGAHFAVINSSLLNASLPETVEQRQWLEGDLAAHAGARIVLFMHHPPYLFEPDEPALGHYDNLGAPDRTWLLGLIRQHRIEALFCGHSHFA
ncbi:MAG TPA: metallophosphoesterase, partial [Chloroflexota bacterium]|nr:metallophosphoesterase [Chloroflexota bacterium]